MKAGDVVQSKMYARSDYAGRKMKIVNIQDDIEPSKATALGFLVLKDGRVTKTIVSVSIDSLSSIKKTHRRAESTMGFLTKNSKVRQKEFLGGDFMTGNMKKQ